LIAASGEALYNSVSLDVKEINRMAILEMTLTTTFYNQININRWHYVSSGDPGPVTPSFALLSASGFIPPTATPWDFEAGTLARTIQQMVSASFGFLAIYVRNLYTPTDFVESAFNVSTVGEDVGEPSPPFLAYGVQSNRVRTDIRRGSKRFGGVSESGLDAGGVLASGKLTQLGAVATAMSAVLSYTSGGASLTLTPAVLSYEEYETDRGNRAYRPYATEAAQLTHTATGLAYTANNRIRSQVSRQVGRGV